MCELRTLMQGFTFPPYNQLFRIIYIIQDMSSVSTQLNTPQSMMALHM